MPNSKHKVHYYTLTIGKGNDEIAVTYCKKRISWPNVHRLTSNRLRCTCQQCMKWMF